MPSIFLFLFLGIFSFASAEHARAEELGQWSDWNAHKYIDKSANQPVCVMWSRSILNDPRGKDQEAKIYISRRLDTKTRRWYFEVAIKASHALVPDHASTLTVNKRSFFLFTGATRSNREAQWAFVRNKNIDIVLTLMRGGTDMDFTGFVEDNRQVNNRFSLFGVSAAFDKINQAC